MIGSSFIYSVACTYIITLVISGSSIFADARSRFISATKNSLFDTKPKHFIECRLCLSFWVALLSCLFYGEKNIIAVYAVSYFLATQER